MNAMPFGPSENLDLHKQLLTRQITLRKEIYHVLQGLNHEAAANFISEVHDFKDESLSHMLADVQLADIHRDILELRDVEIALKRMQTGHYGVCIDCHKMISLARLKAYPTAKRCRPGQEIHEKSHDIPHRIVL